MYVNARAIIERETPTGTEILVKVAERPGNPPAPEFPGGRLDEYTAGPADSIGFFFRCHAEGRLTEKGDATSGHRWVPAADVAHRLRRSPGDFH